MFFTNVAYASQEVAVDATQSAASSFMSLVPMVLIFVIFYFMLIRPQLKKQKDLTAMVTALKKGDKIVAAGGIIGEVDKIEDEVIHVKISKDLIIQVVKQSVTDKVEKTSAKVEAPKVNEKQKISAVEKKKK